MTKTPHIKAGSGAECTQDRTRDTVEAIVAVMRVANGGVISHLADRLQSAHVAEVGALRASRDAYRHDASALLEINKATTAALESAESRLREAERAIAEAPRVQITACNQITWASDFDYAEMSAAALQFKPGQIVAIVPVSGDE